MVNHTICKSLCGLLFLLTLAEVNGYKRTNPQFIKNGCGGQYSDAIFKKVESICIDCYNLYREHDLQIACREYCFSTSVYKNCLISLLKEDELPALKLMITELDGKEPTFKDR